MAGAASLDPLVDSVRRRAASEMTGCFSRDRLAKPTLTAFRRTPLTLNYSTLARIRNSVCVCRRIFGSSDVTCLEMAVKAGFAAGPISVRTARAR